ncbi:uncharacterized protein I303_103916 [Kwoniella dejecticola CBS 10117]|uniref:Uncharacterized protein n=1 Tax=Kwoniella dejecticola CBS 10117 TaxID=1296121 RepID=A0A1A6A830_9TREE|nr:uncharacterized protein I303_03934 [Kwoniella dejecticola CBS 10117]OBR86214.1 hypothetical protein I303_03934 [Kwoniella dejecticola CBS 10117]
MLGAEVNINAVDLPDDLWLAIFTFLLRPAPKAGSICGREGFHQQDLTAVMRVSVPPNATFAIKSLRHVRSLTFTHRDTATDLQTRLYSDDTGIETGQHPMQWVEDNAVTIENDEEACAEVARNLDRPEVQSLLTGI